MPRPRNPNRDKAYELFELHNGNIENRRIADNVGEDEKKIAVWKIRDKWVDRLKKKDVVQHSSDVVQQTGKCRTTKRAKKKPSNHISHDDTEETAVKTLDGENEETNTPSPFARYGNQNAAGNKGGIGGPLRNLNALKTHEYVTVFYEASPNALSPIDETGRALLNAEPPDKYVRQYLLVTTLTIREKCIMQEIQKIKNTPGGMVFDSVTKQKGTNTTSYQNRNKDGDEWEGTTMTEAIDTSTHVAQPEVLLRMKLEDALTRVQGRLQRAIEVWHRMEIDDEKHMMSKVELALRIQRIKGQYNLDELLDVDDLGLDCVP